MAFERMKISMKTAVASVVAAGAVTALSPALASAGPVDEALALIPVDEITCDQARSYWTTEAEYNSIRTQAQAVSWVHPRGGEIRAALARVEEAANRCGLKGGGGGQSAPGNNNPGNSNPGNRTPNNPAPGAPAPDRGNVITVPVAPGTPTFDLPIGDVATVELPDLAVIFRDFLNSVNIPLPDVQMSQLPQVAGSSF